MDGNPGVSFFADSDCFTVFIVECDLGNRCPLAVVIVFDYGVSVPVFYPVPFLVKVTDLIGPFGFALILHFKDRISFRPLRRISSFVGKDIPDCILLFVDLNLIAAFCACGTPAEQKHCCCHQRKNPFHLQNLRLVLSLPKKSPNLFDSGI